MHWEMLPLEQTTSKFDLTLSLSESAEGLSGSLEYRTDLFERPTIERMAGHLQTLLEGIVSAPERRLSELPLLTGKERQQLLVEWNDTAADYPRDKCIHQLFEEQVRQTPDAVAVVFEDRELTYAQLNAQANQLAHYLRQLGVGPEILVAICVERSLEMVVGLLGILKAGGAYVPLDPDYPAERLAFMLEDTRSPVLLTQQALRERLPVNNARVVCLDGDWPEIARRSEANLLTQANADNLAYVIYTSGSTGRPKGVMIEQTGICNRLCWMQATYGLATSDRVLQKTPYSFDVSVWEFFWPLITGAGLVVARPGGHQDPSHLVNLIIHSKVTTLHFVPSMLQVFLEAEVLESAHCLKRVICSGEALPFALQERFFMRLPDVELHNLYGPTEASVDVTFWSCVAGDPRRILPIGRPIANIQCYVLNGLLEPVPAGVSGELHLAGAGLARGYLNRPDLTAEKFIPNPFSAAPGSRLYRTGDLCRWLPDGNLEFLGRIDHQVKIRGYRIELGEIESSLRAHNQVREAVVVAREDQPGEKRMVAYVVPAAEGGTTVSAAALREHLRAGLPTYMVPSAFVFLEALPLTPNGKLDRKALPAPDGHVELDGPYVPPRNPVEEQLCAIWQEVLRLERVGVHDNFFELGGHSLLTVQAMARIQAVLDKRLPLAALFQNPTVKKLASVIGEQSLVDFWKPVVSIQSQGRQPPLFFVPGAGGHVFYLRDLARHLGRGRPFYGLQPPGLDGQTTPLTGIEELAAYFVEAIQAIQPDGPYLLAGHSFGGHVAFEMAQQLQRTGRTVGLLAIVDTTAPRPQPEIAAGFDSWDDATWIMGVAELFGQFYNKRAELSYEKLVRATQAEQLEELLAWMKQVGLQPPSSDTTQIRGLLQVYKSNVLAKYVCRTDRAVPTRIAVFRAENQPAPDEHAHQQPDLCLGWSEYAAGPLEICEVPGDHISMMAEPHVRHLAGRLNSILGKVSVCNLIRDLHSRS